VRAFLIVSALVFAAIGVGVDFESGSHPAGLFDNGSSGFIVHFPARPTVTTYKDPSFGFGGFAPGAFREVRLWDAGSASVLVCSFKGTASEARSDLLLTAAGAHSKLISRSGVLATTLVAYNPTDPFIPAWQVGLVEVRGTKVFVALGSGSSYAAADALSSTFRLPAMS
jgi:hypothetical protein